MAVSVPPTIPDVHKERPVREEPHIEHRYRAHPAAATIQAWRSAQGAVPSSSRVQIRPAATTPPCLSQPATALPVAAAAHCYLWWAGLHVMRLTRPLAVRAGRLPLTCLSLAVRHSTASATRRANNGCLFPWIRLSNPQLAPEQGLTTAREAQQGKIIVQTRTDMPCQASTDRQGVVNNGRSQVVCETGDAPCNDVALRSPARQDVSMERRIVLLPVPAVQRNIVLAPKPVSGSHQRLRRSGR